MNSHIAIPNRNSPARKSLLAKLAPLGGVLAIVALASNAFAHCQIPCGIYGDEMRFEMLKEHIVTIEKSMVQIEALMGETPPNANQVVRWVENKEDHSDAFAEIIVQYFLQQRIKSPKNDSELAVYQKKLMLCHEMLVATMKAKQTTDTAHTDKLRMLVDKFEAVYFGKDEKPTLHLRDAKKTEPQAHDGHTHGTTEYQKHSHDGGAEHIHTGKDIDKQAHEGHSHGTTGYQKHSHGDLKEHIHTGKNSTEPTV